jgi:hypothetical protein
MIIGFFILLFGIGLYCFLKPPVPSTEKNQSISNMKKQIANSIFKKQVKLKRAKTNQ